MANRISIDGERLQKALILQGLSLKEASEMIGRSPAFLSGCIRNGWVNHATEVALETHFDIQLGMYAAENDPEDFEPWDARKAQPGDVIDYERIQECVYHAVYGALKRFEEDKNSGRFEGWQ